jgi:K+-transporting ATPase KdpF subunit
VLPRQDRVKIRQDVVKTDGAVPERVCDGRMTFDNAVSLVIVIALLAYLVAALIFPHKF